MTTEQKIEICRNAIKNNSNRFVHVWFTKKNGELRKMTINRSKKLESSVLHSNPLITEKANATLKANNTIRVEELARDENHKPIHQWHCINLATVKRIAANGKILDFSE